jgi:hypothetical protein
MRKIFILILGLFILCNNVYTQNEVITSDGRRSSVTIDSLGKMTCTTPVNIINTVYVDALGNGIPTPVGGVITLADNTRYIFPGANVNINLANILEFCQDSIIEQARITTTQTIRSNATDGEMQIRSSVLINASAGTLITIPDNGLASRLIEVNIASPFGKVFDIDSDTPNSALLMNGVVVVSAANLGEIDDITVGMFQSQFFTFTSGFVLSDLLSLSINSIEMNTASATTYLDFQGTAHGNIQLTAFSPTLNTPVQYALDFNTGITYAGTTVSNCPITISGIATKDNIFASGSYDNTTVGFKFTGNTNIPDSTAVIQYGFQDNTTTETQIDTIDVPVRIADGFATELAERFTFSNDEVVYDGLETIIVNATAILSMGPSAGPTAELGAYVGVTRAALVTINSFDNTTDRVNETAHGLANGTSIRFSNSGGALPAEIRDDQFYFVVNAATDYFQIEETVGGGVIDFTDDGTGTNYYSLGEYIVSSETENSLASGSVATFPSFSLVEVATGDKIGIFVDNHTNTNNITVKNAQIIVRK